MFSLKMRDVLGTAVLDEAGIAELRKSREERHFFLNVHGTQTLVVYQLVNSDWLIVGKVPVHQLLKQVNEVAQRTILIGLAYILGSMLIAVSFPPKSSCLLSIFEKG